MGTPQFPAIDSDTKQFPDVVRTRLAANLTDPTSTEGKALAAGFVPASGTPIIGTSVFRQRYAKAKDSAIATFVGKLGNRHTTPCDVVLIGDSITEGEGANARAFRYVNVFRDRIRAFYPTPGVAGGSNYLTAYPVIASYPRDPSAALTFDARFGLGRRSAQLATGTPLVFTVSATTAKIAYWQAPGTGSFSYSVNGGAPVTVSTSGTQTDGVLRSITGLSGASDTITINFVSGYVLIEGLYVYNGDETRGVRVWESGHAGWKASDFNAAPAGGTATDWMANITNIQPSLVVIALGANDAISETSASFKTQLTTLITNVRAAVTTPPSIVLIAGAERNNTLMEPWVNYTAAMKSIAAGDSAIDVLDLAAVLPPVKTAPAGWYADSVHPTNRGHAEIANALTEFITP
jgi:lysophospholipase L1-like esterase